MKFSLLTPSLQRESLVRCCKSIDEQDFPSWEHIIQIDCAYLDTLLIGRIKHPQRHIYCCGERHGNYGNRCRHIAWEMTSGEYLFGIDDDNRLNGPDTLANVASCLESAGNPEWAIFPIERHGWWFFNDPPGLCMTDTMNVVVKRKIGRWPDIEAREADGHWVEALKANYPYAAFPNCKPIGVMEYSSNGV